MNSWLYSEVTLTKLRLTIPSALAIYPTSEFNEPVDDVHTFEVPEKIFVEAAMNQFTEVKVSNLTMTADVCFDLFK